MHITEHDCNSINEIKKHRFFTFFETKHLDDITLSSLNAFIGPFALQKCLIERKWIIKFHSIFININIFFKNWKIQIF